MNFKLLKAGLSQVIGVVIFGDCITFIKAIVRFIIFYQFNKSS